MNHHFLHDIHQPIPDIFALNDLVAEAVNDLALFVHHVVVFQRPLANLEVVLFHPLLSLFDRTIQERMFELLTLLQSHTFHHFDDPVRAEQTHEIILE